MQWLAGREHQVCVGAGASCDQVTMAQQEAEAMQKQN